MKASESKQVACVRYQTRPRLSKRREDVGKKRRISSSKCIKSKPDMSRSATGFITSRKIGPTWGGEDEDMASEGVPENGWGGEKGRRIFVSKIKIKTHLLLGKQEGTS